MDVELPDGTIIEGVPEGTTKSQLMAKLKASGYDVTKFETAAKPEIKGEVGFLEDAYRAAEPAGRKLVNVAERLAISPEEFVGGVGEAIGNIPESAVGLGALGYGIAESILGLATPEGRKAALQGIQQIPSAVSQEINRAVMSPVEAIERGAAFAKRDPLGAMAGVSALTGGVGAFMRPGNALAEISRVTNPLAAPGALAQGAFRFGQEFVSPIVTQAGAERAAANQLFKSIMGAPTDVTAALRAEPPSLLGNVPAAERLAAAGQYEPILATLQKDLSTGLTEEGRAAIMAQQQRVAGIQQQIAAIDADIQAQGRAMSPEARAQLSAVRNDLLRARAAELRNLEQAQAQVSRQIPATGQLAPGQAINARAREIRDAFREERITPLYDAAFRSAGNVTIPIRNVVNTAEDILGARLADVPLGVASRTIRDLKNLGRGATLSELDRVRKSVNKDIATAESTGVNLSDLYRLHGAIDEAVEASRIPTRAKLEYAEALNVYRNEFVPRFRTGAAIDMIRTTKKNQSGILPSKTVEKFLGSEDNAAQFAATFGNDAIARQAMTTGIQDLLRKEVVDPTTLVVDPTGIDKFVAKHARQFEIMGIDPEQAFGPVRAEAARLQQGYADLSAEIAFTKNVKTPSELVNKLLDDPAAMDATRRRLTDAGRGALTKEVVDRAIRLLNEGQPDDAIKYLKNGAVRMVVDQPYIDRLKDLAENQKALQEIKKTAPEPALKNFTVDLSGVPKELLLDMKLLASEIRRIEDAERMTGLRPTEKIGVIGAEMEEQAKRRASGFLSREMHIMEKVFDTIGRYKNRKTAAVLADALTKNPSKAADLIERAIAEQNKVKVPETRRDVIRRAMTTGALAAPNIMAPENRNAMAR